MYNPMNVLPRPSLCRLRRKFREFLQYTLPELLVIAGAVLVLLKLINHFFFVH